MSYYSTFLNSSQFVILKYVTKNEQLFLLSKIRVFIKTFLFAYTVLWGCLLMREFNIAAKKKASRKFAY